MKCILMLLVIRCMFLVFCIKKENACFCDFCCDHWQNVVAPGWQVHMFFVCMLTVCACSVTGILALEGFSVDKRCICVLIPLGLRPGATLSLWNPMRREENVSTWSQYSALKINNKHKIQVPAHFVFSPVCKNIVLVYPAVFLCVYGGFSGGGGGGGASFFFDSEIKA